MDDLEFEQTLEKIRRDHEKVFKEETKEIIGALVKYIDENDEISYRKKFELKELIKSNKSRCIFIKDFDEEYSGIEELKKFFDAIRTKNKADQVHKDFCEEVAPLLNGHESIALNASTVSYDDLKRLGHAGFIEKYTRILQEVNEAITEKKEMEKLALVTDSAYRGLLSNIAKNDKLSKAEKDEKVFQLRSDLECLGRKGFLEKYDHGSVQKTADILFHGESAIPREKYEELAKKLSQARDEQYANIDKTQYLSKEEKCYVKTRIENEIKHYGMLKFLNEPLNEPLKEPEKTTIMQKLGTMVTSVTNAVTSMVFSEKPKFVYEKWLSETKEAQKLWAQELPLGGNKKPKAQETDHQI